MTKRLILSAVLGLAMISGLSAQERKELHILSANDMHAAIECMPRLGFVADSLRALYPDLLVLSAGDNRSGEPLNDMYEIPAYPMVALMNIIGFSASTLGNHEFDSGQEGLAKLISLASFPHLCANVHPDKKWNMHVKPYQIFDCGGISVGVLGITALGTLGMPESHPARMTEISFTDPLETINKYKFLRSKCDVVLLLSHLGYSTDTTFTASLPWVDIIVGGHSHTQLAGGEMHHGVYVTQNTNRLARVTHTTLTVENGKVVDRKAENIAIRGQKDTNEVVGALVEFISRNPYFQRVLAQADAPFETYEELGNMMCDAFIAEGKADLSFQNAGGVRYEKHDVGDITVSDVLRLDPFQNEAIMLELTGKELAEMMLKCAENDNNNFPYVGGMKVEYTRDPQTKKIKKATLLDLDGKKLNLKKTYRVVSNSYTVAISPTNRKDPGTGLGRVTPELTIDYLQHQGHVNYKGVTRLTEK